MRARARWLTALGAASAMSVAVAVPAFAHPLGNFTINHYSRVQIAGTSARVLYVLDFAEIPAFQEKQRIGDDPGYLGRQLTTLTRGLSLQIDGRPVTLQLADHAVHFFPGQAGLETERLELSLIAEGPLSAGQHATVFRDANYGGRLGWKEVVVQASGGAQLLSASVPNTSLTDELRRYPQDRLTSPLDVSTATFTFTPGMAAARAPDAGAVAVTNGAVGSLRFGQDAFAALISPKRLSIPLLGFSLLLAIVLGGLHALSPGHGKAVMAGYLVGARGTRRHAVLLGLTITLTHTIGVFALGFVTLFLAQLITPERLYPWLTLFSGVMIVVIGAALILSRSRVALRHRHTHPDPQHGHPAARVSRRSLIALGISGGLIPCPSALVVLLAALSLHRLAFGLLLILFYSVGLAIVLVGIGLALAGGTALVGRLRPVFSSRGVAVTSRLVPVGSALVVTVAGLALTAQALPGVR